MENYNKNQSLKSVYTLMKYTYAIVPIAAGLDKFTNILTDWENYLNSGIAGILPFTPHVFMIIVGIIEIIAGIIVLVRPATGGYIVMAWLTLIALTLLASGNYLDIAVRDLALAVGAFSFVKITKIIS
jgi:uncharacterized membrane protein HdeD (DUF308 family)